MFGSVMKKPSWSPVRRDQETISGIFAISISTCRSMRSVSVRDIPGGDT